MFVITISDLILKTCKYLHILVFIGIECGQSAELRDVCMHSGTQRIRISGAQNGGCTIYKQLEIIVTCLNSLQWPVRHKKEHSTSLNKYKILDCISYILLTCETSTIIYATHELPLIKKN